VESNQLRTEPKRAKTATEWACEGVTVASGTIFCNTSAVAMSHAADYQAVTRAMDAVPRDRFVPVGERSLAGRDMPLPIGCGQTISQPSLVAYMTEQLALTPASRVLELGTGSGFQTAVLAQLAREVFTVERIELLATEAQARLASLGYRNIHFRVGDGARGWPEQAPFDAIIVTAAASTVPAALTEQLAADGRLVIPLGEPGAEQALWLIEKTDDGTLRKTDLMDVRFVPLISP
jgi:protein-L-isoaspartate(D-aspartate) O-methyltransferase